MQPRHTGHVVQGQILKYHQEDACRHAMPRAQAGSRASVQWHGLSMRIFEKQQENPKKQK